MELNKLIQSVASYSEASETENVLTSAFQIATEAHQGFQRISGEPFLNHPLAVAAILAEWHALPSVVAVGLLHDILSPEYSRRYSLDDLESQFEPDMFRLLATVIDLSSFIRHVEAGDFHSEADAEDFRYRMASFLKKERDAVIIKIADRLHNLQTIDCLTRNFQERAVGIGQTLLASLTDRLGMGVARRQLEDYCFRITNPTYHNMLQQHSTDAHVQRTVENILKELQQVVGTMRLPCEVHWQPASLYIIGQEIKLGKSTQADVLPFGLANAGSFVFLTEQESDCYPLLGVIHKLYPPMEGSFRDFISNRKENGYQSLHTQVKHPSGKLLQVIIRTYLMNLVADYGITANWWGVPQESLPRLPEEKQHSDGDMQIFTPKSEVKDLPQGATVLDFAYSIHSDIGHCCAGALVNGIQAEVYRPLQTGDRVEIIQGGPETEPTLAWLDYAQTPQALSRIRQWLTQHRRTEMAEHGRKLLDNELQHLGLDSNDAQVYQLLTKLVAREKMESVEDLLISVGVGRDKASKLVERMKTMRLKSVASPNYVEPIMDVNVLSPNEAQLPKVFARCCGPLPPDEIVGYHRNDGIIAIHKRTCPQLKDPYLKEPEKLMQVKWGSTTTEANYVIMVEALNRPGLASDISTIVALRGLDMPSFTAYQRADGVTAEAHIHLGKTTSAQRSRIKQALEDADYVINVEILPFFPSPSTPQPGLARPSYEPNPYGPTLAEGSRFYGRAIECERISQLLRDQSRNTAILLCGQKRIGKTSLVLRLREQAQGKFYSVYLDMQSLKESSTTQFLHDLMNGITKAFQDKLPEVEPHITTPHFNRFRKNPLYYYDKFMEQLQEVTFSYPLVVILDEFQCLGSLREEVISHSTIFSRLRSHSLHGRGIHFVLSGSGVPDQLPDQYSMASLLSITHNERLGCLEESAARKLIIDGLTKVGNISGLAIDFLFELTAGHPYYLQLLCSRLYEQAQENKARITQDFASRKIEEWIRQTSKHRFQHLWEGYDTASAMRNKLIVSAIAQLGATYYGVEFDRLAQAVCPTISEQSLVEALESLTDIGVLRQNHMYYTIEVKLFIRWLRFHCPLEQVLKEARWQ